MNRAISEQYNSYSIQEAKVAFPYASEYRLRFKYCNVRNFIHSITHTCEMIISSRFEIIHYLPMNIL